MTTTTPRPRMERLRWTPLRDVVRLRLSGRLDARRRVAEFGLPKELSDLALDVAARTKLWRLERADVAEELAGHFAAGRESGVDAEALVRSFGDPAVTARLIRRAKKRDRPLVWRAALWTVKGSVLLVGCYVVVGLLMLIQRPRPSHDYRDDINAATLAVADAERAWPLYEQAIASLGAFPDEFSLPSTPAMEHWEGVVAYLEANEEGLALGREAAGRPGFGYLVGYPAADDPPMERGDGIEHDESTLMTIRLPYLAQLRRVAMLLAADAWRATEAKDGATAAADIEGMIRIAAHVREHPILINDLVSHSIVALASETAQSIAWERPDSLSGAELARMQAALAAADDLLTTRLDGERMNFADLMQRIYSDDGDGDGALTWQGLKMLNSMTYLTNDDRPDGALALATFPVMRSVVLSRRDMATRHGAIMDEMERRGAMPLWEQRRQPPLETPAWEKSELERIRHYPLFLLLPAIDKAVQQAERTRAVRDGAVVALALARAHRSSGAWPDRLEDLVPEFIDSIPVDRIDGEPLRYRLEAGAPLVYSVGPDEDDDGGRISIADVYGVQLFRPRASAADGDWRLWPPPELPDPE